MENKNYLKNYKEYVKKYNMVGSNVIYLDNNGYIENVCSGYADLETNKKLMKRAFIELLQSQK